MHVASYSFFLFLNNREMEPRGEEFCVDQVTNGQVRTNGQWGTRYRVLGASGGQVVRRAQLMGVGAPALSDMNGTS